MLILQHREKDIFSSRADCWVNPVNCVGISGAGLALRFKKKFPENFHNYKRACLYKRFFIPDVLVFETFSNTPPFIIYNFPTKRHWRDKSSLEDLEQTLLTLSYIVHEGSLVALPALGCGLGGLEWSRVFNLYKEILGPSPISFEVYPPK